MRKRTMSVLLAVAVLAGVGVSCTPQPPGVTLLAVVYTNVDGQDGYDPDVDLLIAQFEDTDNDGVPSVGDVIRTNQYPLDQNDVTGGGTFQETQHTITALGPGDYTTERLGLFSVDTDTGTDQEFRWVSGTAGELFYEVAEPPVVFSTFFDMIAVGGSSDNMKVELGSPSQPDTAATPNDLDRPGDDPFIDADITPPPSP